MSGTCIDARHFILTFHTPFAMRRFNFMKEFSQFATLDSASGGSAVSR
jgi:hypothetical protein